MNFLRGYYRFMLVGLILSFAVALIVLTARLPIRVRGIRLSGWLTTLYARFACLIFNVTVHCPDPALVRHHQGFVFPNHVSYLDVLVLIYLVPMRFLAKAEVRAMPLIGLAAESVGSIFVQREDKASRTAARRQLAELDRFPPVALFPEGRRGPGDRILPLRYGAFEIVTEGGVPVLPCVIVYDQLEVAIWHRSENFLKALWRLASHPGRLEAYLIPLETIYPTAGDDPVRLAETTQEAMARVYQQQQTALMVK